MNDYTLPKQEPEIIILGTEEEQIQFDISFINSAKGFQMQQVLSHRKDGEPLSPGIMAQIISIAARGQVP